MPRAQECRLHAPIFGGEDAEMPRWLVAVLPQGAAPQGARSRQAAVWCWGVLCCWCAVISSAQTRPRNVHGPWPPPPHTPHPTCPPGLLSFERGLLPGNPKPPACYVCAGIFRCLSWARNAPTIPGVLAGCAGGLGSAALFLCGRASILCVFSADTTGQQRATAETKQTSKHTSASIEWGFSDPACSALPRAAHVGSSGGGGGLGVGSPAARRFKRRKEKATKPGHQPLA